MRIKLTKFTTKKIKNLNRKWTERWYPEYKQNFQIKIEYVNRGKGRKEERKTKEQRREERKEEKLEKWEKIESDLKRFLSYNLIMKYIR